MSTEKVTEALTIAAADGYPLAATSFAPAGPARASVLLPCAMGVKQTFYFAFAQWLADQGFRVVTFDYRGMGRSAPTQLRGFDATVTDWAVKDYNAVLRWAKRRAPSLPVFVVGHSLGGQLPGLLPDAGLIDGMVTVAAGNGYWRYNALPTRRIVWWLWWVAVPLATRVFGYFPGKRLRKVGDLPRGVIFEWRRWCLHREYAAGVGGDVVRAGYARFDRPLLSLSFTDDEMMSEASIRTLNACYANARMEARRVAPADVGVRSIGHFGFFRDQFRSSLWPEVAQWLSTRTPMGKPA